MFQFFPFFKAFPFFHWSFAFLAKTRFFFVLPSTYIRVLRKKKTLRLLGCTFESHHAFFPPGYIQLSLSRGWLTRLYQLQSFGQPSTSMSAQGRNDIMQMETLGLMAWGRRIFPFSFHMLNLFNSIWLHLFIYLLTTKTGWEATSSLWGSFGKHLQPKLPTLL